MSGKGDARRPMQVSREEWTRRWEATFGNPLFDPWTLGGMVPRPEPQPDGHPGDPPDGDDYRIERNGA